MRSSTVLALACVSVLSGAAFVRAQEVPPATASVEGAASLHHTSSIPFPTQTPLRGDVTCDTPGPVCDPARHPRRPIVLLITAGDPARLEPFARALSSTHAVVTPDLRQTLPESMTARVLEVLAYVHARDFGPCCTANVPVAAVVFMADMASVGLSMLDRGGCHMPPAARVVLVAPRETVRATIEDCSQFSDVGSRMPIVVDPEGGACDQAEAVATGELGAGRVLEVNVPPLCTVDPTAAATCSCEAQVASDQASLARALVAALDPRFVAEDSAGRAFFDANPRDGYDFIERVPTPRAPVGFAFNITMGGGFFVRDSSSGRQSHPSGPAITFRPELTFGRVERQDVGFGLYGEIGSTGILGAQDFLLGVGGHVVLPTRAQRAIVPSFEVHGRFGGGGHGVTAGLYFGHRAVGGLEWPIGLRVDARIGLSGPHDHAFTLSLQGELLAPFALIAMVGG
ncbi:MAG: hypothetical protein KBB95_10585 [Deltaproteobacteria bacterium]|nr:hypothetical protein [Deltaproteobacteria bacterium]